MPRPFYRSSYQQLWDRGQVASALILGFSLLVTSPGLHAQDADRDAKPKGGAHPTFAESDAVRVLDQLRRSLESNDSGRFLKAFDATRMPGYAAFRDQVAEFLGRYDAFQVRYHLTQTTMDGEFGAALADFEFDAHPRDGVSPNVRQRVQLRLVCRWDGSTWKIVDLSPRNWLV
jgi:hypothetical protein